MQAQTQLYKSNEAPETMSQERSIKEDSSARGEKETDEGKKMTSDPASTSFACQSSFYSNIKAELLIDNQD